METAPRISDRGDNRGLSTIRGDINELRTSIRGEINELRASLRGEISELRTRNKKTG